MHANLTHANIVFAVITLHRDFIANAKNIMKGKRALVGIIIIPVNSVTCSFHGNTRKCIMNAQLCAHASTCVFLLKVTAAS